jgi:hypothetical protein
MNSKAWLGILIALVASAGVAFWVHFSHPNWGTDDYSKTVGVWLVLFGALAAAWVSYVNAEAQIRSSQEIVKKQEELQTGLATLNASLALNLEEAKVQIANRYQAQVALNQVAMVAADQIHTLQKGASSISEAQTMLNSIRDASQAMQAQRGALLMVPRDYRDAWEQLQQQVLYIEERVAQQLSSNVQPDLRALYREQQVGAVFANAWERFNEIARFKGNPPR